MSTRLASLHLSFYLPEATAPSEAARRLGSARTLLQEHGLEPMAHMADAWREPSTRIFGGTQLGQAALAAATGIPHWGAGFACLPAPACKALVVSMAVPTPSPASLADIWPWLIGLGLPLAVAMGAELAAIGGMKAGRQDGESGGASYGPELAPGHPPGAIGPWLYLAAARLDLQTQQGLTASRALAARSAATADGGWVLQPDHGYPRRKPQALLDSLALHWQPVKPVWFGALTG